MTDQHTRVTCGGSRYSEHSPVVGLLLGRLPDATSTTTVSSSSSLASSPVITVLDADDIPLDMSEATHTQVALHQAVFPLHTVVGWYRVVSEDVDDEDMDYQPTEEDVRLTRDLRHFFQQQQQQQKQQEDDDNIFLFALLHIPGVESPTTTTTSNKQAPQRDEEQLPLNLFRLFRNSSLVGLEYNHEWKLETSEPERVAIERVIREKPTAASSSSTSSKSGGDNQEADGGGGGNGQEIMVDSGYVSQAHSLQHSLEAMQQRIRIIMDYLVSISPSETTTELQIPPNPALLRQIHSLQCQLSILASSSPIAGTDDDGNNQAHLDSSFLSQLSTISKAVCAIQSYTDKLQVIHEHRASTSGSASGGGSGGLGGGIGSSPAREDRRRRH